MSAFSLNSWYTQLQCYVCQFTMSQSQTRQHIITRDDALTADKSLLKEENNRFELVPFEKYNTHAKLRSQHYNGYFVVCHPNSMR